MFKNYLKIFFRTMRKHREYSIINLFGLTVGMTTCILVLLFVRYEFNWNTSYTDTDRVYRVQQELMFKDQTGIYIRTGYALAEELKKNFPEFEETAVISEIWSEYLSTSDELTFHERKGFYADDHILKIFAYRFMEGSPENALAEPYSIVLTQELAQKYFPDQQAIGKFIRGSNNQLMKVTGIIENLPFNLDFKPDYLVSLSTYEKVNSWKEYNDLSNITNPSFHTIVSLKQGVAKHSVDEKIYNFIDRYIPDNDKKLYLKPITELHINAEETNDYKIALYYLTGISLFVLLLACINFINLATAYSNLRKREIGIRKVNGGNKKSIFIQFIGEFLFFSIISIIFAFVMAELLLPAFNNIVRRPLIIDYLGDFPFILMLLILFMITGIIAGIYPSIYLSSFQPAEILKGRLSSSTSSSGLKSKSFLRKFLVVFQFIISVTIILTTLYVSKQVHYMKTKDLGFNDDNLLLCQVAGEKIDERYKPVREKLLQHPQITAVSLSANVPFHGTWRREIDWQGCAPDDKVNARYNVVDYDFINTYQMEIIKGRDFSRSHMTDNSGCLINEEAWRQFGWDDPVGKKIDDNQYTVIGVIKDFHPWSVHNKIPPFFMILQPEDFNNANIASIRIQSGNTSQIIDYVNQIFRSHFPKAIINVSYFYQGRDYGTEDIWKTVEMIFLAFSIIAILIAANGLYGLISFSVQRRIKEIGIRKILGARISHLYYIITKELLYLLLLAAIISCPLGYFMCLSTPGAYKYQLQPVDFIFSIALMVFTAIIATVYHTTKTVLTNPVESLRYE